MTTLQIKIRTASVAKSRPLFVPFALAAALVFAGVGSTGCTSSRTFVLSEAPAASMLHGISIEQGSPSTALEPGSVAEFEKVLAKKLETHYGVAPSSNGDLVLRYRFVQFDKGHTGYRVVSSLANLAGSPFYGIGDGSIGVEARYLRRDGTELAHIVSDGPISGAFGSTSGAIDAATDQLADFTRTRFSCPTCKNAGIVNAARPDVQGFRDTNSRW